MQGFLDPRVVNESKILLDKYPRFVAWRLGGRVGEYNHQ
jgi:hypothetical protein